MNDNKATTLDVFDPIWRSSTQFWMDQDLFRRWQAALLTAHELTVDESGAEIKLSEDEEKRMHAVLNLFEATMELVIRGFEKRVEQLQRDLEDRQEAARMPSEELMTITRALMPGATADGRMEN